MKIANWNVQDSPNSDAYVYGITKSDDAAKALAEFHATVPAADWVHVAPGTIDEMIVGTFPAAGDMTAEVFLRPEFAFETTAEAVAVLCAA